MTKRSSFGVMAVAAAVGLTVSALIASNMGFKMNYRLKSAQEYPPGNAQGQNLFALPDNPPNGMSTAKNLMDDIGSIKVLAVQKFLRESYSYQSYTGRKQSDPNFALEKGVAYFVKIAPNQGLDYLVAGSDDPAAAYDLKRSIDFPPGHGAEGTNMYAWNYHQTALSAKALMDDIGSANVLQVQQYLRLSDSFTSYSGRKNGDPNFGLTPGEGYAIKMDPTKPQVNYIPSHY